MGVNTQRYVRKPLYVDAVRVTNANFEEVSAWCDGEITKEVRGSGAPKKCIRVRVQFPKNPRQTLAFVGDWILYTERGYKVYTNKAFKLAFDLVEDYEPSSQAQDQTPPPAAEPDVLAEDEVSEADADAKLKQDAEDLSIDLSGVKPETPAAVEDVELQSIGPVAEDPSQETGVQPIHSVESTMDEHTTPQGEPHQYEEATPEGIAEAMRKNTADREKVAAEAVETGDGVKVEESPTSPPVEPPEVAPQPEPISEQPPEIASAGKQVLSLEEQRRLGPDEVRTLVSSGDAILAQDLA